MTATSYYIIIKNCISGDYSPEDFDKDYIRDFLLRQTEMDLKVGDLFLQEAKDLKQTIITMLS